MKRVVWLFVWVVCVTARAQDKVRTWTDVQGRSMQAEFVREVDGDVAFLKEGKLVTVPLERLSEADRKTIRELEASRVAPEETKPAGATPSFVDPTARPKAPGGGSGTRVSGGKEAAGDRLWADVHGNRFTAKFVRVHAGNVVLLRGTRTMTIAFDLLSAADQAYVRELLTARGEQGLLPPAVADNQNSQPAQPPVTVESRPHSAPEPKTVVESPVPERGQTQGAVPGEQPSAEVVAPNDLQPGAQVQPEAAQPTTETRRRRMKFENAQQVVAFFIGLPIIAAIGSLIGAIILRAATYWVTGSHLGFWDAYGTAFLMYIANGFLGFVFAIAMSNMPDETADMLNWATVPIGFLVQSGIIASRLEISFGAACLISLAMMLTALAIVAVIVVVFFGAMVGLKGAASSVLVGA